MFLKKKFFLFCLFSLAVVNILAQADVKIISSADHSALGYATVVNITRQSLSFCNEAGSVKLKAGIGDSLRVSCVGYKTSTIVLISTDQVISLNQEIRSLPGIILTKCKKTSTSIISNAKNEGKYGAFGGVSWSKGSGKANVGVLIKPSVAGSRFNKLSFWIKKDVQEPAYAIRCPLIILFYEVSDSNNLPGNLISKSPLIYFPKKPGKQTIEVDTLNIRIPEKGIYVCFQYIPDEKYEWKAAYKIYLNGNYTDTVETRYGSLLDGAYSEEFNIAFYNFVKDTWFEPGSGNSANDRIRGTIKCEAILSYCSDD